VTNRRVGALFDGLTVNERFRLLLRAMREGAEPDRPALRPDQVGEMNRYLAVARAVNSEVLSHALWLDARLELVGTRLFLHAVLNLWERHAGEIAAVSRSARVRELARQAPGLAAPNDGTTLAILTRGKERLPRQLAGELSQIHRELLALEEVAAWAADEVGDDEPLLPSTSALLDDEGARVLELAELLASTGWKPDLEQGADRELLDALTRFIRSGVPM
jgi:hypothetical protein